MNLLFSNLIDDFLLNNKLIFKKYKPIEKIGSGSYGNVYSAKRIVDKCMFAMKTEKITTIEKTLESEAYYLCMLQGGFGIPKFISYGRSKNYYILIETLLDKNLYEIFIENKRMCTITDAGLIGNQILNILEWIHSKNLIYRDMKPSNFVIGRKDPNVIYAIDFGLCKKYRSSKTGKHILPKTTSKFNGTLKYASSNVIKGKIPTRRDDLIALGYILIYLLKRELPWQKNCEVLNKSNLKEIIKLKETDENGKLFQNIPGEIVEFVGYTKKLKFEEDPDYIYLHSLFNKLLSKKNLNYRLLTFSWIDPKNKDLLGMPKSSQRKSSHRKRLLNSIQEDISRRLTNKLFHNNSATNNKNNNVKQESNTYIMHLDIKKELNKNKFDNTINKGVNKILLANNDNKIKNQSKNNVHKKNKSMVFEKKNIKNKNPLNNNEGKKIIMKNFKNINKNYQNYKKLIPIYTKKEKNNKNINFYRYYIMRNNQTTNYLKNKNNLSKNKISLLSNLKYKSPLLSKRNNISMSYNNIFLNNNNSTEQLNNILGKSNTINNNSQIFNQNKINMINNNRVININNINNIIKTSSNKRYVSPHNFIINKRLIKYVNTFNNSLY